MEEHVGRWWHQWVTGAARRAGAEGHLAAAVHLQPLERSLRMMLHAGGASHALQLAAAAQRAHGGGRSRWQRLSGQGTRAPLPVLDVDALALPASIAVFPDADDNRVLYRWLAAMASVASAGAVAPPAHEAPDAPGDWIDWNVRATAAALACFPGLAPLHRRLVARHLALRAQLPPPARAQAHEARVCAVLRGAADPGTPRVTPADVAPVWLWLLPTPPAAAAASVVAGEPPEPPPRPAEPPKPAQTIDRRRHAERVQDERDGTPFVLPFRAESLLSFAEFIKVNRTDDDDDRDDAKRAADELDTLALARGGEKTAARVRFDLDLPSAAADDLPLGPGHRLPEWDARQGRLKPDWCAVQVFTARRAVDNGTPLPPVPAAQRALVRRVRARLAALRDAPRRQDGLPDGDQLDLDAWVRFATERRAGAQVGDSPPVMSRMLRGGRSLATLLLADVSLSTEAAIDDGGAAAAQPGDGAQRVIDLIRNALAVFGQALDEAGDVVEMLAFSSVKRQHVRIHHLKAFDERWGPATQRRVAALEPGYYTRMGAAIREATRRLELRPERTRLLLILTDGKPHDVDGYEGRYALEDTMQAVRAARRAGIVPFALAIDPDAARVLPQLFGRHGHARVARPSDLVRRLSEVYLQLTRHPS